MAYKEFVRDFYIDGELCPWWKGHVYTSILRRGCYVAPLGFNVIYSFVIEFYFTIRWWRLDAKRFSRQQNELRKITNKE